MKQIKKNLWLLAFIFFLSNSVYSQRKSRLSFTASPSINWMSSDMQGVGSGKVSLGLDYGVNADIYFDDAGKYAFSTGLLIDNSVVNLNYSNAGDIYFAGKKFPTGTNFRYNLKYVEVPLLIKLKTSDFRRWSYWGQFGFSSMINIQAKGESSNGTLNKASINDEVNLFNLALNIGVGSNFDLGGNNAISLGIIYKNGFTDVTSNKMFNDKATLNSLVLKLGLVF